MTTHIATSVRLAVAILVAIALTGAVSAAQAPKEPTFLLEAWAGTNGPDGESWHLVVDGTGKLQKLGEGGMGEVWLAE